MANFILPAITTTYLDYIGVVKNNPVNINLCTELIKEDEPNGYGKKYPIIQFKGCNVKWYYGENGHNIRDLQYNKLLEEIKKRNNP